MNRIFKALRAVVCVAGLLLSQSLLAQTALVTDVSGKATMQGGKGDLVILSDLQRGNRVKVENGARLTVTYVKSGDEYVFTGPSEFMVEEGEPRALTGTAPQKRTNKLAKSVTLANPSGVAQAAVVMRSARPPTRIQLLSVTGGKSLEAAPELRWQPVSDVKSYRIEVQEEGGRTLLDRQVDAASYRIADGTMLKPDAAYTWKVTAEDAQGRRYEGSAKFSIASAALRSQVASLAPARDADFSERVAYAAWLQQEGLHDEARNQWRALSAERPDNATLKSMATAP